MPRYGKPGNAGEPARSAPAAHRGVTASALDTMIATDSNQRVVLFNPAAERMFQVSAEEAAGQPLDRFIRGRLPRGAPKGGIEAFGRTGVSMRHMGALGVVKGLRADGGGRLPGRSLDFAGRSRGAESLLYSHRARRRASASGWK